MFLGRCRTPVIRRHHIGQSGLRASHTRAVPPRHAIAFALLAAGLAGCNGPLHIRLSDHVARPNPRVVMFFIDGLDRHLFRQWLAAGELPNIKTYLTDRGTEVEDAISCLPTITYANTATLLTGRYPGHHGVLGNKWFDRGRMLYQDYGYSETYSRINQDVMGPTLYELLNDRYTVSIQSPLRRGAGRSYDNLVTGAVTWWLGFLDWTDRLPPLRFEEIAQEVSVRPDGRWPKFIHVYFPAVDEYGHRYGVDGWEYKYAVRNADHQIGRICGGLREVGLFEQTHLVLVSDHGMASTRKGKRLDVPRVLGRQFGRKSPWHWPELETDYDKRKTHLDRYDTLIARDGGRRCAIYLRFTENWADRPAEVEGATAYSLANKGPGVAVQTLARWLGSQQAVLAAAVPVREGEAALYGTAGVAVVTRRGTSPAASYRYAIREGNDPLGYRSDENARRLIDGGFHTADEWLAATVRTGSPGVPGQICDMFASDRAGDIVLFAADGGGFASVERAGHGSITAEDLLVPMVWAGPGIARNAKVERARTCDVMPTILDLLGVSDRLADHPPIDGVSLLPKLKKRGSLAKL